MSEKKKHPGGRPLIFGTPEELETACNEYFIQAAATGDRLLISGLCLHLGIDTDTLLNYEKRPEYFGIVKMARLVVQNSLENASFERESATGALFNLKCNFGFRENLDINLGGQKDNPIKIQHEIVDKIPIEVIEQEDIIGGEDEC